MKAIVGKGDTQFITGIIENLVRASGYPVTAQVIKPIGVGREQLRYLERKGLLKSMDLGFNKQMVKGYYTESVWPSRIPVREPAV